MKLRLLVILLLIASVPALALRTGGHGRSGRSSSHYSSHASRSTHSSRSTHASRSTYASRSTHVYTHGTRDRHGRIKRSAAAKDAFKRSHPCPSTGKGSGACPGYVIDHVVPLSKGGADSPANMQWQTTAAAKAKDKTERK